MIQWRSDNFEWKKIKFSLKTRRSYVVPKNAHNTRRTLLCSIATRSACDSATVDLLLPPILSPLLLYIKKKKQAASQVRILYAGRANPTTFCGPKRNGGTGRPALSPLITLVILPLGDLIIVNFI